MTHPHFTLRLAAAVLLAVGVSACGKQEEEQASTPAATGPVTTAPPATATPPPPETQTSPAVAEATPVGARGGEEIFVLFCRACHAPGADHPGTMMLGFKKGPEQAVILNRADLPAEYITQVVRNGLLEMPPLRPTDVTDEELQRLVEYVRTTPADKVPPEAPGNAYVYPPPPEAGGPPAGPPGGAPASGPSPGAPPR